MHSNVQELFMHMPCLSIPIKRVYGLLQHILNVTMELCVWIFFLKAIPSWALLACQTGFAKKSLGDRWGVII